MISDSLFLLLELQILDTELVASAAQHLESEGGAARSALATCIFP